MHVPEAGSGFRAFIDGATLFNSLRKSMGAPKEILELIARFEENRDAYRAGQYNEAQLRREFLDPCFEALGWDVDNTGGYAEAYKDVIHEDQIRVGGILKAPDYCFRIGGTRKFFLEAKKPSVQIKDEPAPAFQLRRYAWSAKLPLSILSDFEEFAIYDGRFKPSKHDSASKARIFYCTFRELAEKWEWLASIFSRDAVLRGAFDKYAESTRTKRGTTEVDTDFLVSMESWRADLARNLALRNPKLTQRELNFAVQRILDRIIFLRICEDRGVRLLRDGGLFSIIVSSSFLRVTYGEPLRRTLKRYAAVLRIVDFGGLAVFAGAKDTYVCIPLLAKGAMHQPVEVSKVPSLKSLKLDEQVAESRYLIPHERLTPEAWSLKSDREAAVFAKIMGAGKPLGEYVDRRMFYGIKTGLNEAFVISAETRATLIAQHAASVELIHPLLGGEDIRRYVIQRKDRFLIVLPSGWTRQQMGNAVPKIGDFSERCAWGWLSDHYPKLADHLSGFAEALRRRQDQGEYWWELRPCDYYGYLDKPKIIFPDICKGPRFSLDSEGHYLANTAYCLGTEDRYLLGVLNSRLFWFAISNISIPFGVRAGEYRYRLIYQYMEKVPIRVVDHSIPIDRASRDRIVALVDQMLAMHRQLGGVRTPFEKTALERQIAVIDQQIDRLICELYGLTPEEIKIVEEAGSNARYGMG